MAPVGPRKRTNDAEAICEAVGRPSMRFVPVKSTERQAALVDHKAREFLVRQRPRIVNAIRAHLAEFGIVIAKGIHNIDRLLATVEKAPEAARPALALLADQLRDTHDRIATVTARVESAQAGDPLARRLASVPGIGTITPISGATRLAAELRPDVVDAAAAGSVVSRGGFPRDQILQRQVGDRPWSRSFSFSRSLRRLTWSFFRPPNSLRQR